MKSKLYISIALLIGIVIMVNLLADEYHFRLDLTENHEYTLSHATRDLLDHLSEPVLVTAYFSEDLPPNVQKTRQDFRDLLIEYANLSHGMVSYKFVDPNADPLNESKAMQAGVRPVLIGVREKDQMKQQKAYLGAVLSFGKKTEAIPFLGPGAPMEYALSSAIKKLSLTQKAVVGFVQGDGEPGLNQMRQAARQLSVLYQTEPVRIGDSVPIPPNIKTLVLLGPTNTLPAAHLQQLDTFLARGGRMLVALDHVGADMRMGRGDVVHTGVAGWLRKKGVVIGDNFVIDAQCAAIPMQQQQGFFNFQTNVSFPFYPMISHFARHPVTAGLENVVLEFASTLRYVGDSSLKYTPLAFTSALSDSLRAPLFVNTQRQWRQQDFQRKGLVVAGALEGQLGGTGKSTKMVVITDGNFPVDGPSEQQQPRQLDPDNVNLLVNAIDWLSDDTGLIGLRTKGVTSRPIAQLSDAVKSVLKYINFLLPLLLVVVYGLIRARNSRRKRLHRMQEDYS
jgi:gliding-associated putative ABC transporter substrate-binding component GldG